MRHHKSLSQPVPETSPAPPPSLAEKVNQDKQVDRAAGVCKKVVAAFSFSWKKKQDLAAAQEYNLPKHKLVSETPTRWGSCQQMVKRVLEQKRATEVLSKDKKARKQRMTELTQTIKTTVMGYLNEKYDDPAMDDLLDMACLVEPRFKLQYTQEEKREYVKDRAVLEMLKGERAVVVRVEGSSEEAMGDASASSATSQESKAISG
ncbi:hypothetical protein SRHO_G00112070 [Serrasalmus rhombeus]